jgi:hypothetical protein
MKIYNILTLFLVLHDCETWSLTLREQPKLPVFQNRLLRRTFGSEREERIVG